MMITVLFIPVLIIIISSSSRWDMRWATPDADTRHWPGSLPMMLASLLEPFRVELWSRFGVTRLVILFDLVELMVSSTNAQKVVEIDAINIDQFGAAHGRHHCKKWIINHMLELWTHVSGHDVLTAPMVFECQVEIPRYCPRRKRGTNLGSFFPSCSSKSRTS
jgi:hypothetical protein